MAQAATTYYVNRNSICDCNDGKSNIFPFKTLAKAAQVAQAGDTVLLYRSSWWEEPLKVISNVTYQDYGNASDPKPIVRGSHDFSGLSWTSSGGGIFVASTSGQNLNGPITQLYYNGTRLYKARYPNVDQQKYFYATNGATQNYQLSTNSADIPAGVNLVGATAHVVMDGYYLRDFKITSTLAAGTLYGLDAQAFDSYRFPNVKIYKDLGISEGSAYWLEDQLWMLDAENEWFFDATAQKLYVRLPGSISPSGQSLYGAVQRTGVDPAGIICATGTCSNTTISNIEVRETAGDGIFFKGGNNISLNNVDVLRAGIRGISLPGTSNSIVMGARVEDSIREGIWMGDVKNPETFPGTNVQVSSSTVRNAGKGYYAVAAIQTGYGNTISYNNIYSPVYAGIMITKDSSVTTNYVEDACYEYGDCAAIYTTNSDETYSTSFPNNITYPGWALNVLIQGNVVNRTHLSASPNFGMKNGIYLDGMSRSVQVRNNFVRGVDFGIFGNFARSNTIDNNVIFKSKANELKFQELSNNNDPHPNQVSCNYYGLTSCDTGLDYSISNIFINNTFVHDNGLPAIALTSSFGTTSDFGSFSGNRYVNLSHNIVVFDAPSNSPAEARTLLNWQATGKDTSGSSQYNSLFGVSTATGAPELLLNGSFDNNTSNWWMYLNADFRTVSTGCVTNGCFAATLNTNSLDAGIAGQKQLAVFTTALTQPSWPLTAGKTYLLTMDAKSDGTPVIMSATAATGGGAPLTSPGSAKLTSNWQHYTFRLYAPETKTADKLNFMLQGPLGSTIYFDNVSLTEAQLNGNTADAAYSFVNPGTTPLSFNCPAVNTAYCAANQYVNAVTGAGISFPVQVPAKSGLAIRLATTANAWIDTDNDGIPDPYDTCANTPAGAGVNKQGCAIGQ
ncbi:MAG: right-handed parallel beta-helix repeat-containing protein [Aquabacterium sp.]